MSTVALYTWMITILFGLLLLIIWIIEYDRDFQRSARTRLSVPVMVLHSMLGMGGLVLWITYLLVDKQRLAWVTVVTLTAVASLGLATAGRWLRVYRTVPQPDAALEAKAVVPPERNFPVPVVITHGVLAVTTIGLVVLTALGVG